MDKTEEAPADACDDSERIEAVSLGVFFFFFFELFKASEESITTVDDADEANLDFFFLTCSSSDLTAASPWTTFEELDFFFLIDDADAAAAKPGCDEFVDTTDVLSLILTKQKKCQSAKTSCANESRRRHEKSSELIDCVAP
jgi:hypothetical protein